MEYCEVCGYPMDELKECKCTKGKPVLAIAVRWLWETDIFDAYEGKDIAVMIKMLETPIRSLDSKREMHHQLAASVATLKSKYLHRFKAKTQEKEEVMKRRLLGKREEYLAEKNRTDSKPWKLHGYEVELGADYRRLVAECDRAEAAHDFIENLMRIMHNRGDDIKKMSDDRRQMRKLDFKENDV